MSAAFAPLRVDDHDRGVLGLRYVYAVRSRRAGGVSLGINLNPNRACNWRCAYCQVPDLQRGPAPRCEGDRLADELDAALQRLDPASVVDFAFSGDGEPTSCPNLGEAIAIVADARERLAPRAALRLITNGSYLGREAVCKALEALGCADGEAWFKIDVVGEARMRGLNGVRVSAEQQLAWLVACAERCRTWVQTCALQLDGRPTLDGPALDDYLALLAEARRRVPLAGVLLYGPARRVQVAPGRVAPLSVAVLERLAGAVRRLGLACRVSP